MAVVGIVIPCYNAARFLPEAIASVAAQTFTDWTCVVVDDCSTDDTRQVAERCFKGDRRFSLLKMANNGGASAARNAGLAAVGSPARYVIFMDSDDRWQSSSLQTLVAALEEHRDWAAVYGNCRVIDCDGGFVSNSGVETAGRERFDYEGGRLIKIAGNAETNFRQLLLRNPVVSPGCMLLRAEAIASAIEPGAEPFNPKMKYGEDLDLWLRLCRVGCIGFVDRTVLDYRLHHSNKTNKRWSMAVGVRAVRLKALVDPALPRDAFHQACAATRAYRRCRIREEIRFARACPYYGPVRAGWHMLGYTVVNICDIVIMRLFEWRQAARMLFRQRHSFRATRPAAGVDAMPPADAPEMDEPAAEGVV